MKETDVDLALAQLVLRHMSPWRLKPFQGSRLWLCEQTVSKRRKSIFHLIFDREEQILLAPITIQFASNFHFP